MNYSDFFKSLQLTAYSKEEAEAHDKEIERRIKEQEAK